MWRINRKGASEEEADDLGADVPDLSAVQSSEGNDGDHWHGWICDLSGRYYISGKMPEEG